MDHQQAYVIVSLDRWNDYRLNDSLLTDKINAKAYYSFIFLLKCLLESISLVVREEEPEER